MQTKHVFIQIGDKYFAIDHIMYVQKNKNGTIDIDYGRDETLVLCDEEASQFLALLKGHCQIITASSERGKT